MCCEQIHKRHDVCIQRPPDEFPLRLECRVFDPQMLGHGLDQRKVDHETVLTSELAVAGFLRIVENFHVPSAGIEDAETDRIGSQEPLRLFQSREGADVDRHQDFLVDGLEKFDDCFPIGRVLPIDCAVFFFPNQFIEEGREGLERCKILFLKSPDERRPILNVGME